MTAGAPNGVSRQRPFDRWFRYPAGFSAATLHDALAAVGGPGQASLVVDPFAGSGSVGTAILGQDCEYVGIEAHPLIAELADLKFQRPGEPEDLIAFAEQIARCSPQPAVTDESELVRRCFDPISLSALTGMRRAIEAQNGHPWETHAKWALLATLRDVAHVKVGWPYQRPARPRLAPYRDPVKRFVERATMMADDLQSAPEPGGDRVIAGDSRALSTWASVLGDHNATVCVSSPPYLNNFDYADATRLEVYFWRAASSWAELCATVRGDMLVATTQQTRSAVAQRAAEHLAVYPNTHAALEKLTMRLATERERRGRGKEYDRVIAPYFLGLARVLAALHEHFAPGATAAWIIGDSAPYGTYIDTPALVLGLAEDLGFQPQGDLSLRTRGQRWRTNGTRHQIALSERLITFTKPADLVFR